MSNLPLIVQIICGIGIWIGIGVAAAAVAWLLLGTFVSLLVGGFLPSIFTGKDGAKRAGWYFGLSAVGGPLSLIGIPLAVADEG
ncbi:hypothetical protein I8H83_04360 [Candidatus Saccharibacteria bacterium]|nr:hypothetical protein [Candidatus Saccharibacteria bacterium]